MSERRRFNGSERVALYLAAGGICESCGNELTQGFEADHVTPYSKGGATDVINGQVLCGDCNRKKGDKIMQATAIKLRKWQEEAFRKWTQARSESRDFLCVATPGSGKTSFALYVASQLIGVDVERIVVVCPTNHIKSQWAQSAHRFGIDLHPNLTNESMTETNHSDFDGICVTYQSVARAPDLHRRHTRTRTLVIFDEIHHAGDDLSWGEAIENAFDQAVFRLALSGTPKREDNNYIPFVHYDDEGFLHADFHYGYKQAMDDRVCRPVFFTRWDGRIRWSSKGQEMEATFKDELSYGQSRERLKYALDPQKDSWLEDVIRDADKKLSEARNNPLSPHHEAAGLIIAKDQSHARRICSLVRRVTNTEPVIAISDEPDSSNRISEFRDSSDRWIVAVKMVSEGVDIPRLRVGVYATNVTSELFFRQAVGRFVRCIGLEDESAYLFIPADPDLVELADQITEEVNHHIEDEVAKIQREFDESNSNEQQALSFPIDSEGIFDGVTYNGHYFAPEELETARHLVDKFDSKEDPAKIAAILRGYREVRGAPSETTTNREQMQPASQEKPKYEKKQELTALCNKLSRRLAFQLDAENPPFDDIHKEWMRQGGSPQPKADISELERKVEWLQQRLNKESQ